MSPSPPNRVVQVLIHTLALSQSGHRLESQQVIVVFSLVAGIWKKGEILSQSVYMTNDRPTLRSQVYWKNQECEGP